MLRSDELDDHPNRVNVIVRVRPRNEELQAERYDQTSVFVDHSSATTTRSVNVVALSPESKEQIVFGYDCVFDDADGQDTVFSESIEEALSASLEAGSDLTVLAYGQTGSGKTYTMLGEPCTVADGSVLALSDRSGVFLRSLCQLLATRDSVRSSAHMFFVLSAVEIYNDVVVDLLSSKKNSVVESREVAEDLVLVNQERFVISTIDDAQKCFLIAHRNRSVSATNMNERSSRSHALFFIDVLQQLIIPQKNTEPPDLSSVVEHLSSKMSAAQTASQASQFAAATVSASMKATASPQKTSMQFTRTPSKMAMMAENLSNDFAAYPLVMSRLTVVDLAGSERIKKSGVQGKELSEAVVVNKSLSALGLVVNCIRNGAKHIPFRDSKLTRLLRPSFVKPAARIVFITNVSPVAGSFSETLSSLRFASRLKEINMTPFALSSASCAPMSVLELRVLKLQQTVEELAADNRIAQDTFEYGRSLNDCVRKHKRSLRLATDSHRQEMSRREEEQLRRTEGAISVLATELIMEHRADSAFATSAIATAVRIATLSTDAEEARERGALLSLECTEISKQLQAWIEVAEESLAVSAQLASSLADTHTLFEDRRSELQKLEAELAEKEYVASHSIAFLEEGLATDRTELADYSESANSEKASFALVLQRLHHVETLLSLTSETDRLFQLVGKLREEVLSSHYASLAAASPKELLSFSAFFPHLQMPSLDEVSSRITTTPPSPHFLSGNDESGDSDDDFSSLEVGNLDEGSISNPDYVEQLKSGSDESLIVFLARFAPVFMALEGVTVEGTNDKRLGVTKQTLEALFRSLDSVHPLPSIVTGCKEEPNDMFSRRVQQLVTAVVSINAGLSACSSRLVSVEDLLVRRIRELRAVFYPFAVQEAEPHGGVDSKAHELLLLRAVRRMLRRRRQLNFADIPTLVSRTNESSLSRKAALWSLITVAASIL
jgi:hypothetical protein